MSRMGMTRAGLTLGTPVLATAMLAAGILAGCATSAPIPPGPTAEEVSEIQGRVMEQWWSHMLPDGERPEVEVVRTVSQDESPVVITDCIEASAPPGFVRMGETGWSFNSDDPAAQEQFNLAMYVCYLQYPVAPDPSLDMLSTDQISWLYDFLETRHRPCAAALGFEFVNFPSREQFENESTGYPVWLPGLDFLKPRPTPTERLLIEAACPLPEMVEDWMPRL